MTCKRCGGDDWYLHPDGRHICRPCKTRRQRERRAAKRDPQEHDYRESDVPDGFEIVGVSQYNPESGKWVKTRRTRESWTEYLPEMVAALCEPFRGTVNPSPAPEVTSDLCTVMPIGDMHVGLRCHLEEVGHEWDSDAAESALVTGAQGLIDSAPASSEFVLVNVGDYLHADNSRGTTTKGTPLDTSGSRHKVLLICLRMIRRCIDAALEKHGTVHAIMATGNHDGESSEWLRICLAAIYEREPRVVVHTSPQKFHYYRFGKCLIGVTHGDTCKVEQLPIIMATDRPILWAATAHRHWYTGHIHHSTVKELPGCTVESFRTLAAQDKWHHWQGYRSERDLRLDVWHRDHGMVQRFIQSISRIQAAQGSSHE